MPDMSQFGGAAPPPGATEKGPIIDEVDWIKIT
jgi:hypothetical protein